MKILNISVGMMASAGKNEQEQLLHAVDEAWNQGIMVVTAAGNNGPKEKLCHNSGNFQKSADGRKLG